MPSATPYAKPSGATGRSKPDTALMRDKSGCITCRVRQKKCTGVQPGESNCGDCIRLNIQCLGVHHNRPDWLRNQEALKETKYRIKHHLTEYPVPRGRGPPAPRPFLSFQDLIEKYSPQQQYLSSGSTSPNLQSERLIRMEPDSPVAYTSSQEGYLCVQTNVYNPHNTPSPSTSYTPMPLTPSSSDGGLFMSPDVPCGYPFGNDFLNQPVGQGIGFHSEPAYIPDYSEFAHCQPLIRGPYRHQHSESVIITSPVDSQQYQYDYPDYIRPSARRH